MLWSVLWQQYLEVWGDGIGCKIIVLCISNILVIIINTVTPVLLLLAVTRLGKMLATSLLTKDPG